MSSQDKSKTTLKNILALCLIALNGRLACGACESRGSLRGDDVSSEILIDDPVYAGRRLSQWIKMLESDGDERIGAAVYFG